MAKTQVYKIKIDGAEKSAKQTKAVKDNFDAMNKSAGKLSVGIVALGSALGNIYTRGLEAARRAVVSAIEAHVKFEQTLSRVKAITGATGEEFKKLQRDALRLGQSTRFTAREVAELQVEYGKLGFTTKEILAASEATLQLATITEDSLGGAAEVAGSTLRAFQLDAEETQRVVDTMARGFTTSALDMESFRESMKFVAPVAAALNLTVEETTALLARLADTGLKGTTGGTALKNTLLTLGDSTSQLSKRLNVTVKDYDSLIDAFDKAATQLHNFEDVIGLTDKRMVAGFTTFIRNTELINKQTAAIRDHNEAAKDMAEIIEDNLAGDMIQMGSAWEIFWSRFTDTAGARAFVQDITDVIRTLAQFEEFIDRIGELREAGISFRDARRQAAFEIYEEEDAIRKIQETDAALKAVDETLSDQNLTLETADALMQNLVFKMRVFASAKDTMRVSLYAEAIEKVGKAMNKLSPIQEPTQTGPGFTPPSVEVGGPPSDISGFTPEQLHAMIFPTKRLSQAEIDEMVENLELERLNAAVKRELAQGGEDGEPIFGSGELFKIGEAALNFMLSGLQVQAQFIRDEIESINRQASESQSRVLALEADLQDASSARRLIVLNEIEKERKAEKRLTEEKIRLEKEYRRRQKALAMGQSIINTALGVTSALASVQPTVPAGTTAAAVVAAIGGIQLGTIARQRFAKGGKLHGKSHEDGGIPGTGSFAGIEVEGGEFIVNKHASARFGPQLQAMNAVKYADGGGLPDFSSFPVLGADMATSDDIQRLGQRIAELEVVTDVRDVSDALNRAKVRDSRTSF